MPNPQFKELQKKYLSNLSQKLILIESLIQAQDQKSLAELFHNLKGNGKTFGFGPISEISAVIDFHHKNQSANYFYWVQLGVGLLKQYCSAQIAQEEFEVHLLPDYQELMGSKATPQKGVS